jgi:hypothetical protein
MAQLVERLSNLKNTEQAWAQIVFRATNQLGDGPFQNAVKAEVEKLRLEAQQKQAEIDAQVERRKARNDLAIGGPAVI